MLSDSHVGADCFRDDDNLKKMINHAHHLSEIVV